MKHSIKRLLDVMTAVIILLILSPFLLIIALMIKVDSQGSVFFSQPRIGQHAQTFNIIKFRTMVTNAENQGLGLKTAENDLRITKVGKYLRKLSLDEIPQLFNVLKGEMSLIGPRPAPVHHLDTYSDKEKKRLNMRPGITGWAQVNGRNVLTWPERIEKDIWYVENYSLWLDVKILFRTLKVILLSEGVYSGRNDTVVDESNKDKYQK
ncbi:exopolysaccharide biosynthesis polyprenyl glycosylphosphotransferase [Salicibibacter cibi]|uniref:Exopolysaccharide biosynthesis polyprenyl glycosylphosphotransferase n=1 Tax=Salicibibacter cibi TaxID=2743001 RepID=A0A7T6ZBK2_9BACI|nr:sugar transferase [Salicibibacter cibi]QQK80443.1 exopolysaccharide biosynthesis polyprenyl glycosylphosphotransferase [Salicibibacter cibi]